MWHRTELSWKDGQGRTGGESAVRRQQYLEEARGLGEASRKQSQDLMAGNGDEGDPGWVHRQP